MMDQISISRLKDNLARIRERIAEAAIKSHRGPDAVTLIAVTKYVDSQSVQALFECGQQVFGESRSQMLWDKAGQLDHLNIEWHMIGHLQRNKVVRTTAYCQWIHSVDSLRLLRAIDAASSDLKRVTHCLLEVNISGESGKQGFQPVELESVLQAARDCPAVNIRGLMGMASLAGHPAVNQAEFARLRTIRDELIGDATGNVSLTELSMGMSGDFEAAIAEGATMVRIGSILFDGIRI